LSSQDRFTGGAKTWSTRAGGATPSRSNLGPKWLSSGLRAGKMDDNLFIERMQPNPLLWEDNDTLRFVLHVREITMLGNVTQVADSKRSWNL
jgi:hypothetical protein